MRPSGPEEEVYCQDCGRYIGSLGRCPYCRTKSPKRLSYKLLKWGGVALAVLGVIGLYVYALGFQGPPPSIRLADVEPTMNFSIVQFENVTVTGARYDRSTSWMSIFIDNTEDKAGSMFVRAYDSETEELVKRTRAWTEEHEALKPGQRVNIIPGIGQKVDITLKLQTSEDFNYGILQVAGGLEILPRPPKKMAISTLVSEPENFLYERVRVDGKVVRKEKDEPFTGTATVELQDLASADTLEVQFPYSAPWFEGSFEERWNQFSEGDTITVTGGVELY